MACIGCRVLGEIRVIEEAAEKTNRVYTRMEAEKVAKLVMMSEKLYGDAWKEAIA